MPPQRQRRRLTTEELARAMGMLEHGSSQRRVANVFGVSQSVISRAWNRFQTSGSATQHHDGGRQRVSTPRQDGFLVVQAKRHPFVNATTLRNELRNAVGVNISTQTVRNRLRQSGLYLYLYTIFDQRRLDIIDQVEHGRSPQQVTHLPPVWDLLLPLA